MRKLLFILSLIGGLLAVPTNLMADEGQKKSIRLFLNTGELLDFDAEDIDSITFTSNVQTIWYDDTCRTIAIETIDSIWYMSPTLKLTTQSLDFGKVAVGNARTLTAMLTNTSNYLETYMTLGNSPFSVQASAKEITILPGESRNIELTFAPTDSIAYEGMFSIASSSVDGGFLSMPLIGEGVAADSLEAYVDTPPVDATFDILLQDNEQIEDFAGFKIVNFNGEYELDIPAMARSMRRTRRADGVYNQCTTNAIISSAGLQIHYFTDALGNPYMYAITLPGEKPEISFTQTAIALLLSTPFLIPADAADYKNTVALLKKLKSFGEYVNKIIEEYNNAKKHFRTPDYSQVNAVPVFNELFEMVKDNRDLVLSGISLKNVIVTPETVSFKLHNDFKRSVAIYASRVKMNESNLVITEEEKISPTYAEVISKLIDYVAKLQNKLIKEKVLPVKPYDGPLLAAIQIMMKEIGELSKDGLAGQDEFPVWVPYLMESGKSDYWDIVFDAIEAAMKIDDPLFSDEAGYKYMTGIEESIFAKERDMSFDFKDFDKIKLDLYGIGTFGDNDWDSFSTADKSRIIFMLLYSSYFDVVEPMLKLITGCNKVFDAVLQNKSEVEGSDHVWTMAYLSKLYLEFQKTPNNWTDLYDNLKKGKYGKAAYKLGKFAVKELGKLPDEAWGEGANDESQVTYLSLLYRIAVQKLGLDKPLEKFTEVFKSCTESIVKVCDVALKTIDALEAGMDFFGAIYSAANSEVKETFFINKYDKPYITVKEPTVTYITTDTNAHFSWDLYVGNNYGNYYNYAMEIVTESLSEVTPTMVFSNLAEKQYDLNLANLPNAKTARDIKFRIIAHHKDKPSAVYVMTDFIPLYHNTKVSQIAPPEMVDLGLPSGTKWAICNLGAKSAQELGYYYAWGETDTKSTFNWKTYKYSGNTSNSLTKYCTKSSYGKVDNKTQLEPADDRVKSDYGYYWSIPTKEDWQELMDKCTWSRFGNDFLVRGPNGSIILLPAAGYQDGLNTYDVGKEGYYWATSIDEGSPDDAWFMHVKNAKPEFYSYYRYQGRCIRPVQHKASYDAPSTAQ